MTIYGQVTNVLRRRSEIATLENVHLFFSTMTHLLKKSIGPNQMGVLHLLIFLDKHQLKTRWEFYHRLSPDLH